MGRKSRLKQERYFKRVCESSNEVTTALLEKTLDKKQIEEDFKKMALIEKIHFYFS